MGLYSLRHSNRSVKLGAILFLLRRDSLALPSPVPANEG